MSKILITGARGQLGIELSKKLKENINYQIICSDAEDLNITQMEQVNALLKQINPDIIINCAAYTNVDKCETDVDNAYKINSIGPRNLGIISNEIGAKIIHISTDYVFDGDGIIDNGEIRPYIEFDNPNPQTIYGKAKLQGEKFVQTMNPRHFIIRTAWLYGEGNNFVQTMLKLSKKNEKIRVVNDQYGSPTSTEELTNMIIKMISTENYGLFHGTCEGSCTWYEFAKAIFSFCDIDIPIVPVTSEEYPRAARRPKYSVLDNYMMKLTMDHSFLHWKEALKKYMTEF